MIEFDARDIRHAARFLRAAAVLLAVLTLSVSGFLQPDGGRHAQDHPHVEVSKDAGAPTHPLALSDLCHGTLICHAAVGHAPGLQIAVRSYSRFRQRKHGEIPGHLVHLVSDPPPPRFPT